MKITVVGYGAVGARVTKRLATEPDVEIVTVLVNEEHPPAHSYGSAPAEVVFKGAGPMSLPPSDATILTVPDGNGVLAARALHSGSHVVSTADDLTEVRRLLSLDELARDSGLHLATGVAMAPGLTCVLARFGSEMLDRVEEVHVASFGTGGPACARSHHAALTSLTTDWEDAAWRRRPGGSGRELLWFPEPIGGADCYRARRPDPVLLHSVFADARRITSRLAATRRDRLTSWLPMMRRPHPEGLEGAVRTELRGWSGATADIRILGGSGRPAVIAAEVAALTARWAVEGRLERKGAGGLAELVGDPRVFLSRLRTKGIAVSVFEGDSSGR